MLEQTSPEVVAQLGAAKYATLTSRAVTDDARALIDRIMERLETTNEFRSPKARKRKNKRSAKAQAGLRKAMEGFVGDLLRAYSDAKCAGWVYRSLKANAFSGESVSYRQFMAVLESLGKNFVERRKAYRVWSDGFEPGGSCLFLRGKATRFRATTLFIGYCREHGLYAEEADRHFIQSLPEKPLVKRAGNQRDHMGNKVRGRIMPFERTGKALQLEQQVRDLNEFIDSFDLRGGPHRGYIRLFNQGDHADFDWNKGGRLYSQGDDSYQRLSRDERLQMTINGEPVCEIDIRASYLTIYHAHHGEPLDTERDPYELPGLPKEARWLIKLWFVATFGNNGHLERWPREISKEYRQKEGGRIGKRYPVKSIRDKALERYPLLHKWGADDFGWADLMFLESQAIIGAMTELKMWEIPSLAVHDSLIVPLSASKEAQAILTDQYTKETGAVPVLTVKYPPSHHPAAFEAQEGGEAAVMEEWTDGCAEIEACTKVENDKQEDREKSSKDNNDGDYDSSLYF